MGSILSSIMQAASQWAQPHPSTGRTEEDRLGTENRAAYRKLLEMATKEGSPEQVAALAGSAPEGVDVTPFTTLVGIQTPEQKAKRSFDDFMGQAITQMISGGQPTAPQVDTTKGPSLDEFAPTPTQPMQPSTGPNQLPRPNRNAIFSNDFLMRSAIKKFTNIDVGAHYFEAPQWFADYGDAITKGVPVEQAVSDTATKYGFIPDGASNLKGLPEADRKAIFEREFSSALNEPTLDAIVQKMAPKGANIAKLKAGLVLDAMAGQGRYIPEHYQPLLDRWRGLEDPKFISDQLKTHIYQTTGKMPSDIEPEDVSRAQRELDDRAIIQSSREMSADTLARLRTTYGVEHEKPISAEDLAKYGVRPTQFPTYATLAESGKRFNTEDERKVYEQMLDARQKLFDLTKLMFGIELDPDTLEPKRDSKGGVIGNPENGIFTGIKPGWWGRAKGKVSLTQERMRGTQRGQYAEEYSKIMADIARTLLVISKDTRFSDVDVQQMMQTQGDLGIGILNIPDSAPVAYDLIKRFLIYNGRYLDRMIKQTTVSGSAPILNAPTDSDAAAQALIEKYKKGAK